jgi:hypothetical protein
MNDFEDINRDKIEDELVEISDKSFENESFESKSLKPKERKTIRGWLIFFLIAMAIGATLSIIYHISHLSLSDYETGLGYGILSVLGAISDIILWTGCGVLAVCTIISFYKYSPNAVFLAKSYIVIIFVTNLIPLLSGGYDDTTVFDSSAQAVRSLIWGIIWFLYFCYSEQVNSLFPKTERKIYKRDKILLFSIVSPGVIWMLLIYLLAYAKIYDGNINMPTINEKVLTYNEYTDGKIIFEKPEDFEIEKQFNNNETYHTLRSGSDIVMTICGVYDDNDTPEYFEECMQSFKDGDLDGFDYEIIDEHHYNSKGNSIYLKIVQYEYESEPVIEWSFVLMFNKETKKCCVITYYSTVESDYLGEIINSVRFKE